MRRTEALPSLARSTGSEGRSRGRTLAPGATATAARSARPARPDGERARPAHTTGKLLPFSGNAFSGTASRPRSRGDASFGKSGARSGRQRRPSLWHTLPVLPILGGISLRAVLSARFLGIMLMAVSAFTLMALFSPHGSLTEGWADRARALAGWAAALWCIVLFAAGLALYRGRQALRRAIAGRLAGATLVLVAAIALSQLIVSPPPRGASPASILSGLSGLSGASGSGGYLGLIFGAATAAWFGARGATLLLLPLAMVGVALLCGWSLGTWQRLGRRAVSSTRQVIRFARWAAHTLCEKGGRAARWAAGIRATGTAKVRTLVHALRQRYRAWRTTHPPQTARPPASTSPGKGARAPDQQSHPRSAEGERPAPQLPQLPEQGITVASIRPPEGERSAAATSPHQDPANIRWQLPSTAMLSAVTAQQNGEGEMIEKARLIEATLGAFNVPVTVKEWRVGPTVTQFSLKPGEGVSVKRIKLYEADLQLVLAAQTLRIELPVPGRPVVGIEIPNSGIATVGLREIIEAPQFRESKGHLRLALGRDVDGNPRVGDLAKMPHLLIAGQTGSGKSICVNTIIAALLFQATPDELNLLMIDPKMVEMAEYEGIPHLRYPVVVDLAEAGKVLLWAVEEMERRYRLMAEAGFRHIDGYNKSLATAPRLDNRTPVKPLPYIVLIIDELADLMMFAPDDVEPAICRLTAKARAVGIHLVVATQRPSVDVVTGLIKANMPSRIAFAVSSQIDSRVVLDMGGAESLLGRGDMLYLPYDQGKPLRVQGAYVSDEEISNLIHFWKKQGSPQYVQKEEIEALLLRQEAMDAEKASDSQPPLVERAVGVLRTTNYTSISFLQRKLNIGYPRAARLMDELEVRGLVQADEGNSRSYRVVAGALPETAGVDSV